jgi:hypothetical protein
MFERFTIESEPPQHSCYECAESVPAVITALQLAYDQELLIILHDEQVTDEICVCCQRPIATVLAPAGLYQAEVTLTIQCRVSLTARSAPQAYNSLRYLLWIRSTLSVRWPRWKRRWQVSEGWKRSVPMIASLI